MRRVFIIVLALAMGVLLAWRCWDHAPLSAQSGRLATENGDVNGDGVRDVADPIHMLNWLFYGGAGPVAFAQEGDSDLQGTWIAKVPVSDQDPFMIPAIVLESFQPLDSAGNRFQNTMNWVNGDSTFGGIFVEADDFSPMVGTYVRTGPNTFDFTSVAYAIKRRRRDIEDPTWRPDRSEIQYFWHYSGTAEILDDNTLEHNGVGSLFSAIDDPNVVVPPLGINGVHDQDADNDGFPEEGEVPIFCFTFPFAAKRLDVIAPCVPPMPGGE